jgi:hypothetical protein
MIVVRCSSFVANRLGTLSFKSKTLFEREEQRTTINEQSQNGNQTAQGVCRHCRN